MGFDGFCCPWQHQLVRDGKAMVFGGGAFLGFDGFCCPRLHQLVRDGRALDIGGGACLGLNGLVGFGWFSSVFGGRSWNTLRYIP